MGNPYAQVALTYLRRPFASSAARFASASVVCVIIATALADRYGTFRDSVFVQLMYLFSLFIFLALHMKGQFVDSRAHLMPGYRYVHATIAAAAALIVAGVLPAAFSWFMGWHGIGFVAVVVLLFGTILWVIVRDATWTLFAIMLGWMALCSTESGPAWFRELLAGQIESQAVAILVLGILVTLLAGIQLVRLSEDRLTYDSTLRWNWDWSQKTRQGWSGEGRILPGLRDWIRERGMTRLTRLARHASESWWSRICRWQMGMVAGCSLWFWILGVLVHVQAVSWWILVKSPKPTAAMMNITSFALTIVPAMIAAVGMARWRTFRVSRESLLPVERKSYLRQLVTAAAVSHFQLWGGMTAALVLWWLLISPWPLPLAAIGGVLAFSAAVQVAVFGVAVWTARYRSGGLGVVLLFSFFFAAAILMAVAVGEVLGRRVAGTIAPEVMWIAGVVALLGLLITWDAYRRWLVADFD